MQVPNAVVAPLLVFNKGEPYNCDKQHDVEEERTILHEARRKRPVHALQANDLAHHLPPDEGVELEDDRPWVNHSHPNGVPPRGNCLDTPVLGAALVELPGALHEAHKLLLRDEEGMRPLVVKELQVVTVLLCERPA